MSYFMAHDSGELIYLVHFIYKARIKKDMATRPCKGVELIFFDNVEIEGERFCIEMAGKIMAKIIDELNCIIVFHQMEFVLNAEQEFIAQFPLLINR